MPAPEPGKSVWPSHADQVSAEATRVVSLTRSYALLPAGRRDPPWPAPSPQPAESLTFGPGLAYRPVTHRGLHVVQQTCRPGVRESKVLSAFEGNVMSVDTRPFRRPREVSPFRMGQHWFHNAERHFLVREAMGKAMVKLLEGRTDHSEIDQ